MSFRVPPIISKIISRLSPYARSDIQSTAASADSLMSALNADQKVLFKEGIVSRTDVGFYSLTVLIPNFGLYSCVMLNRMVSPEFGASECLLPPEGSRVLVMIPDIGTNFGYVLGVIPPYNGMPAAKSLNYKVPMFSSMLDLESNGSVGSERAYSEPLRNSNDVLKINSNAGRPLDLLPGGYSVLNTNNVGYSVTTFAATLRGGPKAQVRVSAIDDAVMVVSEFFQHINAMGNTQIYNDGGRLTWETTLTEHQCERLGCDLPRTRVFSAADPKTLANKSRNTSLRSVVRKLINRKRLSSFVGFLGDLINIIISSPNKNLRYESMSTKVQDNGLCQFHVDSSGRVMVRAANGIILQRTDKIAVPKRLYPPWDPEGDKVEDEDYIPPKEPFQWNEEYSYARILQLRDSIVWRTYQAYQRIIEQSTILEKKDFYLPSESSLSTPNDEYDIVSKSKADFSKNSSKQSLFLLEEDGSIVLRDAWGSEIIMRDGDIIISAARQIRLMSADSTIVLAGHDFISKARKSIDITATDNDVRIKANVNLHLLSEGRSTVKEPITAGGSGKGSKSGRSRSKSIIAGGSAKGSKSSSSGGSDEESQGGGILIESRSSGIAGFWDGEGELIQSRGIVLKSMKSPIGVFSDKLYLSGSDFIRITSNGDQSNSGGGQKSSGNVYVTSKQFLVSTTKNSMISNGSSSAVIVANSGSYIVGPSTYLIGGGGANVVKGDKVMIPLTWASIPKSPYSELKKSLDKFYELIQGESFMVPFLKEALDRIRFTYRTDQQYGTDMPNQFTYDKQFYVGQPFWSYLYDSSLEEWEEYEIEKTMPWPGYDAYEKCYLMLSGELNIGKPWNKIERSGGEIVCDSFSQYKVVEHKV